VSRSKSDRMEKVPKPPVRHVRRVLCDNCGAWYPEDEMSVEVDAVTKKVTGRFCGVCA